MRTAKTALLTALAILSGCQSSSQLASQRRSDSISVVKGSQVAITPIAEAATSGRSNAPRVIDVAANTTTTSWSKLFSPQNGPQRMALPRNDQQAENPIGGPRGGRLLNWTVALDCAERVLAMRRAPI